MDNLLEIGQMAPKWLSVTCMFGLRSTGRWASWTMDGACCTFQPLLLPRLTGKRRPCNMWLLSSLGTSSFEGLKWQQQVSLLHPSLTRPLFWPLTRPSRADGHIIGQRISANRSTSRTPVAISSVWLRSRKTGSKKWNSWSDICFVE